VNLQFLEGSIQNQLTIYRETARQEWIAANEAGVSDGGASATVLLDCYDLAAKAEKYLIEISDEIAKGDGCELRIDKDATAAEQETHYTLKSVEEWATKTLGLSVIQTNIFDIVPEAEAWKTDDVPVQGTVASEPKKAAIAVDDDAEVDAIEASGKGLGKIKANNLYVAFAFLVNEYAKTASGYATKAGDSIEDAIAGQIEASAKIANNNNDLYGLGKEAIRKNIAEAMKRKANRLAQG
jgi:hypothetical protein